MQIRFVYSSSPINEPGRIDALLTALPAQCRRQEIEGLDPEIEVSRNREVNVGIVVNLNAASATHDATRIATDAVHVFSRLASEFQIRWDVGHEHDPHLGTVAEGVPVDDLIDEVRTAVEVARSLVGMLVDDEFVEPDSISIDPTDTPTGSDPSWDELFQPPDSFIRFPELD